MPINHKPISESEIKGDSKNIKSTKVSFYEIEPKYNFSDIVLSDDVERSVKRTILFIKNQKKIFEDWNLESVIHHHNLCINLYGASGTGKTMTAHAIASELGRKLIIVNYAEIESKYVGETSKNLTNLFSYAGLSGGIILFDEADALLSRRVTAMHSATDVSVNQTRNTLLKILDEYEGIVIFTTNFIQNFDSAFLRRIFSNIEFKLPNEVARKKLWEHYLINTIPIDDREKLINSVSSCEELSGSDIATIVLKSVIDLLEYSSKSMTLELVNNVINEVKSAKIAVEGKYEITTRKVSEEYALQQLQKGGNMNGIIQ